MASYTQIVELKEAEIRAVKDIINPITDKKTGETKEYHHIELTIDEGEDMLRTILKDKNMENLPKYKRGMIGTFIIRQDIEDNFGLKLKQTVVDFIQNK